MLHLEWKLHTSVEFVPKSFLAFMRCDNTKQANMEFRWNHPSLTWTNSLKKTTQSSRKSSKHFNISSLTLSEKGRYRVFNFAMSTFDNSLINKKLDLVFKGLNCAAKVNLAFGFVLKYVEDGSCRYFYAHENNTVVERSKLVSTPDDITNLKEKLQKMDIVDLCTRERTNTKWKFYKLTNLTVFAALLIDVPMGCIDSVLPEPLLKNQNVNCLTFEKATRKRYNDNLCLFRAVALHLVGNERLEETSKIFKIFLNNCGEGDPSKFQGVHMTDIPKVEAMLQLNIFLYDIDFVGGELIGELARSFRKFDKNVQLLRYNNQICYVIDINSFFKSFCCSTCDTIFSKTGNLERHLITCSERVKNIYPKNVYQLRETLFENLDSFNIPYREDPNLFKNLAVFDFESICVKEETYKETNYKMEWETCSYISFNFVKSNTRTHFPTQFRSSTPCILFYQYPWRLGNAKQSTNEIKVYWSRDRHQD